VLRLIAAADEFMLTLDADDAVVATSVLRPRDGAVTTGGNTAFGQSFVDLLPAAHRASMTRLLADVRQQRRPVTQHLRFDGRTESFACTISAVSDATGGANQLICVLRNHAATVQPAVDRFDEALSLARVAWFERDLRTDIGIGSPSLAQIYGLEHPRGPWHFDEVRARILPEDLPGHHQEIAAGLERRFDDLEARVLQYRIRRPDGTVRHLEVRYRNLYSVERPRTYGLIFDITEAKQIEGELVDSRNWLNLALRAARIFLWERELATDVVRTSSNFAQFTGLQTARTTWTHQELLNTMPEDARQTFDEASAHWIAGREVRQPRVAIRLADGTHRWIESSGSVQSNEHGQPTHLLGITWDVTSVVEQELARKASDERLRRIADLVPGVVYQFKRDPDGHYSFPYASDGIRDIYGVTPDDVQADAAAIMASIHPEDLRGVLRSMRVSAEQQTRWQHHYRVVLPERGVRWVMGTATPQLEPDGATLWHGHIVDVTDRHEAESLLRESEARLSLALSAAGMASWQWDLQTDQVTTTRALSLMLGFESPTVSSDRLFSGVHPADVDAFRAQLDEVARTGYRDQFSVEYRFRWADGVYRWAELRARGVFDEHGKITAYYGVSLDIDERRRTEAERERLLRQLSQAQKMEAIGLLTGGIAHDFNNILASVLGYSSLALQRFGAANPGKLSDYLSEVIKAGERARDLVAQMLAFSRGETSEVARLEAAPLVEQMMKMLRPILPSSIEIRVDIAPDLPAVTANAVQLQQVLLNLCINARDATNGVGTIAITARYEHVNQADCASCHHRYSGKYVVLSVSDDGSGIQEAQRTRIFEPFFTTKSEQKGTGMGLATVHGIVHHHGGHLGLVSTIAVGSTFSVALPVADVLQDAGDSVAGGSEVEQLPVAAWPARILVVDDEPSIAQCTAEVLEIAGFRVSIETDSLRAAERLRAAPNHFDLLVTDQTMPRLTGHQLAIEAMIERPDLPVLLVTGHSAAVDEQQALALGIKAFLRKPVPRIDLLNAVKNALPEAAPRKARARRGG